MDREVLTSHISETFKECFALLEKKNADYASDGDGFGNLVACEKLGLCDGRVGILVRMLDKMSRIANLMNRPAAVTDESLLDSLNDLINYAALLKAMHESKTQ